MRIIGGSARGTKLFGPAGPSIRPTLDRVRESFFNWIQSEISGAWFLDLFAGTGAVGIEALSRGAREVVFVEPDAAAQKLIYKNLGKCKMFHEGEPASEKNWFLMKTTAQRALKILEERHYRFDLVYVDPPFGDELYEETLSALARTELLKEDGKVIVEHYHKEELEKAYGRLSWVESRKFGDTRLSLFEL